MSDDDLLPSWINDDARARRAPRPPERPATGAEHASDEAESRWGDEAYADDPHPRSDGDHPPHPRSVAPARRREVFDVDRPDTPAPRDDHHDVSSDESPISSGVFDVDRPEGPRTGAARSSAAGRECWGGPGVFDVDRPDSDARPDDRERSNDESRGGPGVFDVDRPDASRHRHEDRADSNRDAGSGPAVFDVDRPDETRARSAPESRGGAEVFDVDRPAPRAGAGGESASGPGVFDVDAPADEPDAAFEVERDDTPGWVALAPMSGETFDPAQAWADGPEVDRSPVSPLEMTGLWLSAETGRESPLRIDGQPIDPRDAGVDDDLALRLLDLSDMWQRDWDPATGWRPRARPDDFEALARHLARRLKDAVGATDVTLYLSYLGHGGVEPVPPAEGREPLLVRLMNDYGQPMPVWGEFVTEYGVGSFSSELNLKLEAWAQVFDENMDPERGWARPEIARAYRAQGEALAEQMRAELGPDYRVDVDLWELDGLA